VWAGHARAVLSAAGYCTAITLVLMLMTGLTKAIGVLAARGMVHAAHRFWISVHSGMLIVLLAVPFLAVMLHLAPRRGLRRLAWCFATAVVMAFWAIWVSAIIDGGPLSWIWFLDCFVTLSLFIAASAYNNSARTDAGDLLQHQIEQTSLEAELTGARLALLRAQIEPHFLFNTLATIRALGRNDHRAAAEMVGNLQKYLAVVLPAIRQPEAQLATEMKLVEAYLAIYQVRMGRRLAYEVDAPRELEAQLVPTMVLLTLAENALKHGVGPMIEGGFIRVRARRQENRLVLEVGDTGRGLAALQGYGTGLSNIRSRLLLRYGNAATLSLRRGEPRGTIATVSIPLGAPS
jgi:hypothetical protein